MSVKVPCLSEVDVGGHHASPLLPRRGEVLQADGGGGEALREPELLVLAVDGEADARVPGFD